MAQTGSSTTAQPGPAAMNEREPIQITDVGSLKTLLDTNSQFLAVILFYAPWSGECRATQDLTREMIADPELSRVLFIEVPAEKAPGISKDYEVTSVPTIVFARHGAIIARIVGSELREYRRKLFELNDAEPQVDGVPTRTVSRPDEPTLDHGTVSLVDRLKALIRSADVMVFMKGDPSRPRCGFSRQLVEILNNTKVPYKTFDILEDEDVRQGLKDLSNWQTYPQVYVQGEFVGGLDIIKDMVETDSLIEVLTNTNG